MTGTVSWDALTFIAGLIVTAGGIVAGGVIWLMSRMSTMQREHDAFRLAVAEKYAPLAALFKVEERVALEMRNMRTDFNAGFDRVVKVMQAMVPPSRRSKSADPEI